MIREHQQIPFWFVAISFLLALILTVMPLPVWAISWRPDWLPMVLIFWCLTQPRRYGVLIGWGLGLLLDVLQGSLLGQHALGLALTAYVVVALHQRIRVYPLVQQALVVAALLLIYRMLMLWLNTLQGLSQETTLFWLPAISSMFLWPWLYVVLRDFRHVRPYHH